MYICIRIYTYVYTHMYTYRVTYIHVCICTWSFHASWTHFGSGRWISANYTRCMSTTSLRHRFGVHSSRVCKESSVQIRLCKLPHTRVYLANEPLCSYIDIQSNSFTWQAGCHVFIGKDLLPCYKSIDTTKSYLR